jgi:hypothetical protein
MCIFEFDEKFKTILLNSNIYTLQTKIALSEFFLSKNIYNLPTAVLDMVDYILEEIIKYHPDFYIKTRKYGKACKKIIGYHVNNKDINLLK